MANMKLYKPNRQTSDEEQQQRQPTPSHDHAASRLVKKHRNFEKKNSTIDLAKNFKSQVQPNHLKLK